MPEGRFAWLPLLNILRSGALSAGADTVVWWPYPSKSYSLYEPSPRGEREQGREITPNSLDLIVPLPNLDYKISFQQTTRHAGASAVCVFVEGDTSQLRTEIAVDPSSLDTIGGRAKRASGTRDPYPLKVPFPMSKHERGPKLSKVLFGLPQSHLPLLDVLSKLRQS